jgi:hypothetical protein
MRQTGVTDSSASYSNAVTNAHEQISRVINGDLKTCSANAKTDVSRCLCHCRILGRAIRAFRFNLANVQRKYVCPDALTCRPSSLVIPSTHLPAQAMWTSETLTSCSDSLLLQSALSAEWSRIQGEFILVCACHYEPALQRSPLY